VKFLQKLDAMQERAHNGISAEMSEKGFPRMMKGNLRQLGAFLRQGNNLADMNRLMGEDAAPHFLEMHSMLNNAQFNRASQDVVKNALAQLKQDVQTGIWQGGTGGGILGHWHIGAMLGAGKGMANFTVRQVMRSAMQDSRLGKAIMYAAQNDVNPKIYAPLIARMMVGGFQQQDQDNTESAPEQAGGGKQ